MAKTLAEKPKAQRGTGSFRPNIQDSETGHRWLTKHRLALLNTIALRVSLLQESLGQYAKVCGWILGDLEKVGGPEWARRWKKLWERQRRLAKGL